MRWLLLAVLLLPLAAAHGDVEHGEPDVKGFLPPGTDLNHIQAAEVTLAPGERGNYTLSFSGAPFKAGWHWLIRADVDEGGVGIDIFQDERLLARHNLGEGSHVRTQELPFQATMRLELRNVAEGNTTVRFYYDQTCECQFKRVPLQNGPVWFNIHAEEGQRVSWQFTLQPAQLNTKTNAPVPQNVTVRARHMVVDDDPLGGYVPGATTREILSIDDPQCRTAAAWNGCIELDFTATQTGQQLVWFDVSHEGDPSWTYMILPVVEVTDPVQTTPMPWGLALLGLAFAYRRAK